jgi:RNase adaptor protein for sRNA GlmZ degradation
MTAGTGRGINDPINFPLLLVLSKIESAAAETRGLNALLVDGGDERLKQRYMESRWLHPPAGDCPIMDGDPGRAPSGSSLRDSADLVIDTSVLTRC